MEIFLPGNYENEKEVIILLLPKSNPMKNYTLRKFSSPLSAAEKDSEKVLMEKMGMSKKEIREVYSKYGVSASKLLEIMQLSKYEFIYTGRVPGQCEPCMMITKMKLAN